LSSNNIDTKQTESTPESPKWNWTTKLVVGLALVAMAIWVLVQFQNFLGPLITAFVLAYLIHPIAGFLQKKVKIPWRLSVTLIYIVLVLAILGLLTWGGFALFEQIQNLIRLINNNIDRLPDLIADITEQTYEIGPFTFAPTIVEWDEIANQIVSAVQPILGRIGSIASSVAAGAASTISWVVLILLVSYFLVAESAGIPDRLLNVKIPGFTKDLQYIGDELKRIWNAFIRGEILVVFFSLIIYTVMLGILGVQAFFGLAMIAAVGQLIPYLGAWITWISFGLVALFQTNIPFNLSPGIYMIIVLGVSMVINNIIDNILRTKVMASSLKVHPAVVLIGALIGLQLFGFIGIIIAAPVMATFKLLLNYIIKKLNDQDPWEELELHEPIEKTGMLKFFSEKWGKFRLWVINLWNKVRNQHNPENDEETLSSEEDPTSKIDEN